MDALSEWSDWLTPVNLQGTQAKKGTRRFWSNKRKSFQSFRFDTIFYTAQLDSIPPALQDQTEVNWKQNSFHREIFLKM